MVLLSDVDLQSLALPLGHGPVEEVANTLESKTINLVSEICV